VFCNRKRDFAALHTLKKKKKKGKREEAGQERSISLWPPTSAARGSTSRHEPRVHYDVPSRPKKGKGKERRKKEEREKKKKRRRGKEREPPFFRVAECE